MCTSTSSASGKTATVTVGVHATLCFGLGNALNSVNAAFVFQSTKHRFTSDVGHDFLKAAHVTVGNGINFGPPTLSIAVVIVGREQLLGKKTGLIAAGSGSNLQHDIFAVVGVFR